VHADDEVIQRAKNGDSLAWRELYRDHAGRLVVWLASRPSGDAAVAPEDLAAEAWLTAARRIADFTGTSDEFAGWLFGIARNLAGTTRRRSLRRDTHASAMDTDTPDPREGPELHVVARDWVSRSLASLTPRERDVVACIDVVGLDVESTARALNISPVAVRVARHRGLRRLRKQAAGADDRAGPASIDAPGVEPAVGQPSTASSRSR
jgi:RNA polymerase sigma-70 factor (ECF subfamily)